MRWRFVELKMEARLDLMCVRVVHSPSQMGFEPKPCHVPAGFLSGGPTRFLTCVFRVSVLTLPPHLHESVRRPLAHSTWSSNFAHYWRASSLRRKKTEQETPQKKAISFACPYVHLPFRDTVSKPLDLFQAEHS